jgi:hypothetical protein
MTKKLGPIQQWMKDHPDDEPYPGGGAGQWWRRKRGLDHIYNLRLEEKARLAEEKKRAANREAALCSAATYYKLKREGGTCPHCGSVFPAP